MQLLIVHRDSEVGEPLVQMVKVSITIVPWHELLIDAVAGNKEEKAMTSRRQSA